MYFLQDVRTHDWMIFLSSEERNLYFKSIFVHRLMRYLSCLSANPFLLLLKDIYFYFIFSLTKVKIFISFFLPPQHVLLFFLTHLPQWTPFLMPCWQCLRINSTWAFWVLLHLHRQALYTHKHTHTKTQTCVRGSLTPARRHPTEPSAHKYHLTAWGFTPRTLIPAAVISLQQPLWSAYTQADRDWQRLVTACWGIYSKVGVRGLLLGCMAEYKRKTLMKY